MVIKSLNFQELILIDLHPTTLLILSKLIQNEYPNSKLVYLLGGDSLENLPFGTAQENLFKRCHELGVMRRMGANYDFEKLEIKIPGITAKIKFVDTPLIEIAASQIRTRIRDNEFLSILSSPTSCQVIENRQVV